MSMDLAIVLGSTYTSIFLSGQGVVLREPTIAAYIKDAKKIKAAGNAALMMMGKTPDTTTLINPIKNGVITEPRVAAELLKEFILRLYPDSYFIKPKINAIVGIPTGLSKDDCEMYYSVLSSAGISGSIFLVPKIMMAAVGMDLPVSTAQSSMVVSLGGGSTEMAVIALSGILSSGSWGITIGGEMMDKAICDYIAGKYNLKIGLNMARRVKENIGSLYENERLKFLVKGIDLSTKMPSSAVVESVDLREVLMPYYLRIAEVVETAINGCNPEISCDILRSGIYFCGGSSLIAGLGNLLKNKLDLKINIAENPQYCAIVGGGKLLKNRELLEDILS